jgi:hypothetical protein
MKIEDLERANMLAIKINETESLIEMIKSTDNVLLRDNRNQYIVMHFVECVESQDDALTILAKQHVTNKLNYYHGILCKLIDELDEI